MAKIRGRPRWWVTIAILCGLGGLAIVALWRVVPPAGAAGGNAPTALGRNGEQIAVPPEYLKDCAECHGQDASGNGPKHTQFIPPPANLTLVRDTPTMFASIVRHGIQGTAMPAFGDSSDQEINEFRTFVTQLVPQTQNEWQTPYEAVGRDYLPADMGRSLFIQACSDCHGINGDAQSDDLQNPHIWPKPANFHARNSELGRVFWIVSYGRPGTMMAPQAPKFQSLNARWALATYVYNLYDPTSTATIPTGPMAFYRNPDAVTNQPVVQRGQTVADLYCNYCHGGGMQGSFLAPSLVDRVWRYGGGTDNAVFTVITEGIPGKLMPPHDPLPESDRWAVVTYFRSQGGLPDPLARDFPPRKGED